jgi:hypothetical protein
MQHATCNATQRAAGHRRSVRRMLRVMTRRRDGMLPYHVCGTARLGSARLGSARLARARKDAEGAKRGRCGSGDRLLFPDELLLAARHRHPRVRREPAVKPVVRARVPVTTGPQWEWPKWERPKWERPKWERPTWERLWGQRPRCRRRRAGCAAALCNGRGAGAYFAKAFSRSIMYLACGSTPSLPPGAALGAGAVGPCGGQCVQSRRERRARHRCVAEGAAAAAACERRPLRVRRAIASRWNHISLSLAPAKSGFSGHHFSFLHLRDRPLSALTAAPVAPVLWKRSCVWRSRAPPTLFAHDLTVAQCARGRTPVAAALQRTA